MKLDYTKLAEEKFLWFQKQDVDTQIDYMLPYFIKLEQGLTVGDELENAIWDHTEFKKITNKWRKKLVNEGLMENIPTDGGGFTTEVTSFAKRIVKEGGWLDHLLHKKEREYIELLVIKSTINTNNLQKGILWITAGLSVVTVIISFFTYLKPLEPVELKQPIVIDISPKGRLDSNFQGLAKHTTTDSIINSNPH